MVALCVTAMASRILCKCDGSGTNFLSEQPMVRTSSPSEVGGMIFSPICYDSSIKHDSYLKLARLVPPEEQRS